MQEIRAKPPRIAASMGKGHYRQERKEELKNPYYRKKEAYRRQKESKGRREKKVNVPRRGRGKAESIARGAWLSGGKPGEKDAKKGEKSDKTTTPWRR